MRWRLTVLAVLVVVLVSVAGFSAYRSFAHPGSQHPGQAPPGDATAAASQGPVLEGMPAEEGQMFMVQANAGVTR